MRIRSKIGSFKRSYLASKYGFGFKDKIVLFVIGLRNQADSKRRIYLHIILQKIIDLFTRDGISRISLINPFDSSKMNIKFRNKNQADYQSIFECLASDMYLVPDREIRYVFDGGANLGFFSIFSSYLKNIKEIVVVEPNPENLPFLRNNISTLKNYIEINLQEVAISDNKGKASFEMFSSNNSQLENVPGFGKSKKKIDVNTDSIINLIPSSWDMNHTWLKLDIEGAEYKALNQLLDSKLRPAAISLEIHDYLNSGGDSLVNRLHECGYSVEISGYGDSGYVCRQINANLKDHI